MSSSEFTDNQGRDEFEQLISGVRDEMGDTIAYNERDGYYAVQLRPDIAMLREAFSDHVKAYYDLAPGEPIPDDYFDIVDYHLNAVDAQRLKDVKKDDVVSTVGKALFLKFAYFEGGSVDYDETGEMDALVGKFYRIITVPIYSQSMELNGNVTQTRAFEPALILIRPSIEDASGERHDLGEPFVCVPFMSADIEFVKRIYQERNL